MYMYAMPAWGPLICQSDMHRLHNWGICIPGKFDHVSEHHSKFHLVSSLIKYRYFIRFIMGMVLYWILQ